MTDTRYGSDRYGSGAYAGEGFLARSYPGPGFDLPTVTVEVAWTANASDPIASMAWTPLDGVRSIKTRRGKQHERNTVQAGTMTLLVDNRDGRLSPWNTASPYYPNVLPMRPIRVTATWAGTVYPVWFGYVEAWPMRWADPVNNDVEISAVDGFGLLANATLATNNYYRDTILADTPLEYWRLGDVPRSPTAADSSGNGHTGTIHGTGPVVLGVPGALTSSTDTAMTFGPGSGTDVFGNGYYGMIEGGASGISGSGAFSVELWLKVPPVEGTNHYYIAINLSNPAVVDTTLSRVAVYLNPTTGGASALIDNPIFGPTFGGGQRIDDDKWHHVVLTRSGTDYELYVDAVQVAATTATVTYPALNAYVAGQDSLNPTWPGSLDEVAIYGTALSAAEVAAHYQAATGWVAQSSGDRINTALDAAGWPTADRSIESGSSTLQAETTRPNLGLPYLQLVEKSEDGLLFMGADGQVKFYGRSHPLTNARSTTAQVRLGGGSGEEPYRLDGTNVGLDNLDIWNQAIVSRVGGAEQVADDTTSQATYGRRTFTATGLLCGSDAEANDRANWIVSHYKDPQTRVGAVSVDPRSDPTNLFPKVLGLDFWDRATFKRATLDGGSTFQADQLIEGVEHQITPSRWRTVWNLSPAEVGSYWIWGTSLWGSTTRWAY